MDVTGFEEAQANIEKCIQSLSPEEVEPVLLEGAQIIADAARSKAPQGKTGNLKASIESKLLPRRPGSVAAIAAVNYRKGPHAHLVEFGHINWRGGNRRKGKGLQIGNRKGKSYFTPAHPFMRPAWDENIDKVSEGIITDLKNKVEEAPS